jgi:hypothetical protein
MRKITSIFAALACMFFLAMPASADVLDDVLLGLNGVVTSPMDVVLGAYEGSDTDLPLGVASPVVAGLGNGVVLGATRAATGLVDLALAPANRLLELVGNPLEVNFGGPFSPTPRFYLLVSAPE